MGAVAIVVVNLAGLAQGKPDMPGTTWAASALVTLVCTSTFAALGVFVGYVVPGENAMQILGPGLALLSFLGGVFIRSRRARDRHVAVFTPMYGVAEVAGRAADRRVALVRRGERGRLAGVFVAGAAWRMTEDTAGV